MKRRDLTLTSARVEMVRRGVTILEVVVVVGIIGVLIAIVIPAVQYARESARRTQCQNNQRQIMQACHAFEAARGSLPSLYNGTSLAFPLQEWDLFPMHSWRVELLSYLEKQPLRDSLNWSSSATDPAAGSHADGRQPAKRQVCSLGYLGLAGFRKRAICRNTNDSVPRWQIPRRHRRTCQHHCSC